MPDILINGAAGNEITVLNRGLHYGDGLFETMRVQDGTVPLWSRHYHRLAEGCSRLGIEPPAEGLLGRELGDLVGRRSSGVVKLIVTAGATVRGYLRRDRGSCRILLFYPPPEYPAEYRTQGVRVRFCDVRLSRDRQLAGIKHLNRLQHVLARNEWQDPGIAEGLLLDDEEHVIESTSGNVFVLTADGLQTPDLTCAGVKGIMRQIIMEIAAQLELPVSPCKLRKTDVLQAEGVFLTNSVAGIWPVRELDGHRWEISNIIKSLQDEIKVQYGF